MMPRRKPSNIIPAAARKEVISKVVAQAKRKHGPITQAEVIGTNRSFDPVASACRREIMLRLHRRYPRASAAELNRVVGLPSTSTYIHRVLKNNTAATPSD